MDSGSDVVAATRGHLIIQLDLVGKDFGDSGKEMSNVPTLTFVALASSPSASSNRRPSVINADMIAAAANMEKEKEKEERRQYYYRGWCPGQQRTQRQQCSTRHSGYSARAAIRVR